MYWYERQKPLAIVKYYIDTYIAFILRFQKITHNGAFVVGIIFAISAYHY